MKPRKLKTGDMIGIVAPSRPIYRDMERFDHSVAFLERKGFRLQFGKHLHENDYYSAGTPEARAEDINAMFSDPDVVAVWCASGGSSANQIVEMLDYDIIRKNPKPFLGYSDITTLHLAIHAMTGLETFYSTGLLGLAEGDDMKREFLLDMLSGQVERCAYPNDMEVWRPGHAEGKLLGGCFQTLNGLLGSRFSPDYDDAIFFWEDTHQSPAMLDFQLNQFKLAGNLGKISAMVIGHIDDDTDRFHPEDGRPLKDIVLDITKEFDFPIVKIDWFGHAIDGFLTVPIGTRAELNTDTKTLRLLESPVE